MQVENILQSKGHTVHTVEAGAPLSEALRILNSKKIGAVVVVDAKGKVAGILSERDIVRHLEKDPVAVLAGPGGVIGRQLPDTGLEGVYELTNGVLFAAHGAAHCIVGNHG